MPAPGPAVGGAGRPEGVPAAAALPAAAAAAGLPAWLAAGLAWTEAGVPVAWFWDAVEKKRKVIS